MTSSASVSRIFAALSLLAAASLPAMGQATARSNPGISTTSASGDAVFSGVTEPYAKVDVPASTRAILADVFVKEGQAVKADQPLAKLDDTLQIQQVELARLKAEQDSEIKNAGNNIAFAENELNRLKTAHAGPLEISQKELAILTAKLGLLIHQDEQKQNQVRLQEEKVTLERMTIKSPIDGFVLKQHKQKGEMTDDGPVITVVQISKINALFYLPKALFGKFAVGDKVPLEFESGVKREGVVSAVEPVVSAAGTFRVKVEVDNADNGIPAGLSVTWTWAKK